MRILEYIALFLNTICEVVLVLIAIMINIPRQAAALNRVYFMRNYDYRNWLKRDLADCDRILELGCGDHSPILYIGYGQKTDAIDIWEPYIQKHNRARDYLNCWQADILKLDLPENNYDAVVIFDVFEHLPRKEVEEMDLWGMMEKCARKKVICFTPNGFIENDEVDGDPYQTHISAWEPDDFISRGYDVVGATGWRRLFGKASLPKYHPYAICAIFGMLSKAVVFNRPRLAWHSYAVKEVNNVRM